MPVYNLGKSRAYHNCLQAANTVNFTDAEIIFVDDGSIDDTVMGAHQAAAEKKNIKVVSYLPNRGKGYALLEGFKHSRGDYIVFIDGDLDVTPDHIEEFIKIIENTGVDIVVGSRKHPQSQDVFFPFYRRLGSEVYHWLVKVLLIPVSHQAGIKMYKRKAVECMLDKCTIYRYGGEIEQLVIPYKNGFSLKEAPIRFKIGDETHMRFNDFVSAIYETGLIMVKNFLGKYDK